MDSTPSGSFDFADSDKAFHKSQFQNTIFFIALIYRRKVLIRSLLILLLLQTAVYAQDIPAYKNGALPVEERVADLLPRMTLEEKVAQLTSTMEMLGFNSDAQTSFVDKEGNFLPERAAGIFKHGIGQISRSGGRRGPKEMAEFTNTVQRKNKAASTQKVIFAEGCRITETDPGAFSFKEPEMGDPAKNAKRIKEAVKIAKEADVIILALGGNEFTSREAWIGHLGDRDSLELPGNQNELVEEMLALKKPIVVFLLHGRPNSINYIAENIPAILEGWYLGQEGGNAAADVLFGSYNPGGKLPLSVPRSAGQLPVFYNHKPTARRGYVASTPEPLYPFGWGLSYTTFKYENLSLTPNKIGSLGKTKVTVNVTNTGKLKGDEVVQLYIRDEVSSVTRPVKELKGFKRVSLDPGETKTIEFNIGPEALSFLNRDMRRVVEPGRFKIMAGGNSVNLIETTLEVADVDVPAVKSGLAPVSVFRPKNKPF